MMIHRFIHLLSTLLLRLKVPVYLIIFTSILEVDAEALLGFKPYTGDRGPYLVSSNQYDFKLTIISIFITKKYFRTNYQHVICSSKQLSLVSSLPDQLFLTLPSEMLKKCGYLFEYPSKWPVVAQGSGWLTNLLRFKCPRF